MTRFTEQVAQAVTKPVRRKYRVSIDTDLGIDWADSGPWRSFQLMASGDTREELLEDATIFYIDQDGGELGSCGYEHSDNETQEAVEREIDHALGLALLKEKEVAADLAARRDIYLENQADAKRKGEL